MRIGFVLFLLAVSAGQMHGQGMVNFRTTTMPVDNRVRDCFGNLLASSAGYRAELMYAPDGISDSEFTTLAIRFGSDATVGLPAAGSIQSGTRTVPTAVPGGFGLFQVRVWRLADGADWAAVMRRGDSTMLVAESRIMRVDTANPLPPAETAVDLPLRPFELVLHPMGFSTCVPEPSMFALGTLGLGALLLLRRRK